MIDCQEPKKGTQLVAIKEKSKSPSQVPVSLIPYTSGNDFGSAAESYKEKLLIPQRERDKGNRSFLRIKTTSSKGSAAVMRKSTIPKTPPACFSRRSKARQFTEKEVQEFENYFRESKYFASTGKIPAEWLIHFSDEKLEQVVTARKKVLKERQLAGNEAWKKWKEAESQRKPFPPTPIIKDGCWGREHIKREPSHMTEEDRESIWREWKSKKEEQIRKEKEEEKKAREKLIEEAMKLANHRRLMAAKKKAQQQGLLIPGIADSDFSVNALSEVTEGDESKLLPKVTGEVGGFQKDSFTTKTPQKRGSMRKRKPNDVKVAMCLASLSPYLVHPSAKYKKENLHALEEMKSVQEMYRNAGPNGKLHLPKLWRKRIKEAEPRLFHYAKENQLGDLSVSTFPSQESLEVPHSVATSTREGSLPLADTSIIVPLTKEIKRSASSISNQSATSKTKSGLKEKYNQIPNKITTETVEEKVEDDYSVNFDMDEDHKTKNLGESIVEEKLGENFVEINTNDTYDVSNKDELPVDKPFKDDADYYNDYSFCSEEGQEDELKKKSSGEIGKESLKELQGAQADRPESRSSSRGKN